MRTLLPNMLMAVGLTLSLAGSVVAAPVPGNADYDGLYNTAFAQCTVPAGSAGACEAAINAYSGRLVADGVSLEDANASFTALRAEVFAANASDPAFQALIDALFEQLLPDSGAVVVPGDDTPAETLNPGSGTPLPATPS